jgi:hypothetical protein
MQSVTTYREKHSNTWLRVAGPGMVLLAAVILLLRHLADSQLGIMISLGGGTVLAASLGFFLFCREVLLNPNLLVLDAQGFTQVRGGKPRRWLWWDLSSWRAPVLARQAATAGGALLRRGPLRRADRGDRDPAQPLPPPGPRRRQRRPARLRLKPSPDRLLETTAPGATPGCAAYAGC